MIYSITSRTSKKRILDGLDPLVADWFSGRFPSFTKAQAHALPSIHKGRNTLVCTPTGSGKTLTAFLSVIDSLVRRAGDGTLENRIYCVYISPLRALANDVEKNLKRPLEEIFELAEERGERLSPVRVGVRTGDTSQYEKQKMLKKAPHILITTPETLAIAVATTRFSEKLTGVGTVIVDEIHELCDSKRGSLLTLTLEMLQELVGPEDFVRVGLSATISPINDVARFLVGARDGLSRPVHVYNDPTGRRMDLAIRLPVRAMADSPTDLIWDKAMDLLVRLIREGGTTLVFTNTRKRTETVVMELAKRGVEGIAAHHGSLAASSRQDVEHRLKEGELRAVVTSTSLELGIDIGAVDQVVQLGSPKSVSRALQRTGRAGHSVGAVSRARFIPLDRDDLVELAVLLEMAREGRLDSVPIPRAPMDVLAQALIGMGLSGRVDVDGALAIVRRAWPYRSLRKRDMVRALEMLAGGPDEGASHLRARIWYDGDDGTFRARKGMRRLYFLNLGTIPQENMYRAQHQLSGEVLGTLSESFVQGLNRWDVFSLGGRPYQLVSMEGSRAIVREAPGLRPTVPSWTGEMLPRTPELSRGINRLRRDLDRVIPEERPGSLAHRDGGEGPGEDDGPLAGEGPDGVEGETLAGGDWAEEDMGAGSDGVEPGPEPAEARALRLLGSGYLLDGDASSTLVRYFRLQKESFPTLPGTGRLMVEGYVDADERKHVIFHLSAGRRVTEPLARAFAVRVSELIGRDVHFAATDDGFMLSSLRTIPLLNVTEALDAGEFEEYVTRALDGSELLRARSRHTAMRSFAILRSYGPGSGRNAGGRKGRRGMDRLVSLADRDSGGFMKESALHEIMGMEWDLIGARRVLEAVRSGGTSVVTRDYDEVPTPFAHSMVLAGAGDLVLLEDRRALMRQLHWDVLGRIVRKKQLARGRWERERIGEYFLARQREALERAGPAFGKFLKEVGACTGEEIRDAVSRLPKRARERLVKACGEARAPGGGGDPVARNSAAILGRLRYFGPHTAEDLAATLSLDGIAVKESLDALGTRAALWSGCAVDGAAGQQYLLIEDAFTLDGEGPDGRTFTRGRVGDLLLERYFPRDVAPWDLLGRLGTFTDFLEVYVRTSDFRPGEWGAMIKDGYLLCGKVGPFRGRRCWFRPEDAPLLAGARRALELPSLPGGSGAPGRVLKTVRKKRALARKDLVKYMDIPRRLAVSATAWLERTGHLLISPDLYPPGGFGRPRGQPGGLAPPGGDDGVRLLPAETAADILTAYTGEVVEDDVCARAAAWTVGKHGPMDAPMCAFMMGAGVETAQGWLEELESRGELVRIRVLAPTPQTMYATGEQLRELSKMEDGDPDGPTRLLPPTDPFGIRLWHWRGLDQRARHYVPGGDGGTPGPDATAGPFQGGADPGAAPVGNGGEPRTGPGAGDGDDGWFPARTGPGVLRPPDTHLLVRGSRVLAEVHLRLTESSVEVADIMPKEVKEREWDDFVIDALSTLTGAMEFYKASGIGVLRVRNLDGIPSERFTSELLDGALGLGFQPEEEGLVWGAVQQRRITRESALHLLFTSARLAEDARYPGPGGITETHGPLRSDLELAFRTTGRFYGLKEFARNNDLVAAVLLPQYRMYTTGPEAGMYKAAKSLRGDKLMVKAYRALPPGGSMGSSEWERMCDYSPTRFKKVRKRLMDGTFVGLTPLGKYFRVSGAGAEPPEKARGAIVLRYITNCGMANLPTLMAYFGKALPLPELRDVLARLEGEGELIKGYFIADDPSLYYSTPGALDRAESVRAEGVFVLSPRDPVYPLVTDLVKRRFGRAGLYVLFDGIDMVAGFKASERGPRLMVDDFLGGVEERIRLERACLRRNIQVVWKDEEEQRRKYMEMEECME